MSGLALALTVVSSLGWAGFDATRKALSERLGAVPLVVLLMVGQLPFFGLWIAWDASELTVGSGFYLPAAGSVALNVAANLCFVTAVRISPLSVTIPMLSFSPAFSALIELMLFGDAPASRQWLGMAIVIAGALGLHIGGARGGLRAFVARVLEERGSLLMGIVALLWSLSGVCDKAATAHASASLQGFTQCAGVALALGVYLVARGRVGELGGVRAVPGLYALALGAGVVALGVQLLAYQAALVGLVEAVKRAIGMLAALTIGRIAFGEQVRATQVAAVLVMAAGVALIALPT